MSKNFSFLGGSEPPYTPIFHIDAQANVGIGTTQPTAKLQVIGDLSIQGSMHVNSNNISVSKDILPTQNETFDIGSSNYRFKDLWLSGNTLHVGDTSISKDDTSGALKVMDSATQSLQRLVVKEMQIGGGGDASAVVIKKDPQTGEVKYVIAPTDSNGIAQVDAQETVYQSFGGSGGVMAASNILPGSFQNSAYTFPSDLSVNGTVSTPSLVVNNIPIGTVDISDNPNIDSTKQVSILRNSVKQTIQSPSPLWTVWINETTNTKGSRFVTTDSSGNAYIAGLYSSGPFTFRNANGTLSSVTLPSRATQAVFLTKYDPDGMALWAATIDGTSTDTSECVAVDSEGNIYITGMYNSSSTVSVISSNGATNHTLRLTTNEAMYTVKFNSAGISQWVSVLDGSSNESGFFVTIDKDNNVIVGGNYRGTPVLYDAGNVTSSLIIRTASTTGNAGIVIKYTLNGTSLWAATMDSAISTSNDSVRCIVTDASSNVYCGGLCNDSITIYNGNTASLSSRSVVSQGGFIAKLDANGAAQWISIIDGTASEGVVSMILNPQNELVVTGNYSQTSGTIYNLKFYNANGQDSNLNTIQPISTFTFPSTSTYIVKYNEQGNASSCSFVSNNNNASVSPSQVVSDSQGNIYLLVFCQSGSARIQTYDFGSSLPSKVMMMRSAAAGYGLLIKYNAQGIVQWCNPIESGASTVTPRSLRLHGDNTLFVVYDTSTTAYSSSYPQRVTQTLLLDTFVSIVTVGLTKINLNNMVSAPQTYDLPALNDSYNGFIKYLANYSPNSEHVLDTPQVQPL